MNIQLSCTLAELFDQGFGGGWGVKVVTDENLGPVWGVFHSLSF